MFPRCFNVIIPKNGSINGRILKLYVEINLRKPLLRGTKVKLNNETVWVEFRYEQLLTFYFFGGIVGCQERMCERKVRDSTDSNICKGQYGEWMRGEWDSEGKGGSTDRFQF